MGPGRVVDAGGPRCLGRMAGVLALLIMAAIVAVPFVDLWLYGRRIDRMITLNMQRDPRSLAAFKAFVDETGTAIK